MHNIPQEYNDFEIQINNIKYVFPKTFESFQLYLKQSPKNILSFIKNNITVNDFFNFLLYNNIVISINPVKHDNLNIVQYYNLKIQYIEYTQECKQISINHCLRTIVEQVDFYFNEYKDTMEGVK